MSKYILSASIELRSSLANCPAYEINALLNADSDRG